MRSCGRTIPTLFQIVTLAVCVHAVGQGAPPIPAHKSAIVLFDGSDLKSFDTFLKSTGLNSDPEHVFQVENGVIHVSGKEMGYLITKKAYQSMDGTRVAGPAEKAMKIDRFGKGASENVVGFRDPVGEVEKPHGEWNVLELVTQGNDVKQYVNGKLVNEGT